MRRRKVIPTATILRIVGKNTIERRNPVNRIPIVRTSPSAKPRTTFDRAVTVAKNSVFRNPTLSEDSWKNMMKFSSPINSQSKSVHRHR